MATFNSNEGYIDTNDSFKKTCDTQLVDIASFVILLDTRLVTKEDKTFPNRCCTQGFNETHGTSIEYPLYQH